MIMEFFLDEFHWIHWIEWIMTKSKKAMATSGISLLLLHLVMGIVYPLVTISPLDFVTIKVVLWDYDIKTNNQTVKPQWTSTVFTKLNCDE